MKKYDEIRIENLQIFANHGVFPEETKLGQKFLVSVIMYVDTKKAGQKDDLNLSIDYGSVSHFITRFLQEHTYKLIEAAAEHLAEELLLTFPLLKGVSVELKKPWAPVALPLDTVSVKIERFWHQAYVALGSNIGDKKAFLDMAVEELNKMEDCKVERVSDYITTAPYGGVEQDDFLNGCVQISTLLTPEELLSALHGIEGTAHRKREVHWGPRTLDLDILLYDDLIYESENLMIPHVEMHLRDFVLEPLAQIAPWVRHPGLGKTVKELLDDLK